MPYFFLAHYQRNYYYIYMSQSTITKKGQTTIPGWVRRALGLEAGTQLHFEVRDGEMIVRPQKGALSAYGFLKKNSGGNKDAEMQLVRESATETWAKEAAAEGVDPEKRPRKK